VAHCLKLLLAQHFRDHWFQRFAKSDLNVVAHCNTNIALDLDDGFNNPLNYFFFPGSSNDAGSAPRKVVTVSDCQRLLRFSSARQEEVEEERRN
jgi:hypothetical protein